MNIAQFNRAARALWEMKEEYEYFESGNRLSKTIYVFGVEYSNAKELMAEIDKRRKK